MTRTRYIIYLGFAALAALALVMGLLLSQLHGTGGASGQEGSSGSRLAIDPRPGAEVAGWVLNQYGEPVAGLRVELLDIGHSADAQATPRARATPSAALTDDAGSFRFDHLREVEHELITEASGRFEAVRRIVHPGQGAVTVTLEERETIQLSGVVQDGAGTPLAGVRVVPLQLGREATPSDSDGRYRFDLPVDQRVAEYTVRFVKQGYREASVVLSQRELERFAMHDQVITLQEEGPQVRLSGILEDATGAPVSGETITLYSNLQRARYAVVSDEEGHFEFPRISAAGDYRLWVYPLGPWADYLIPELALTAPVPPLRITLIPLATSPFEGRLVDDAGNGVAYQHLVLSSDSARGKPLDLFSGADGSFYVEAVPEGPLHLRTLHSPYVHIEGLDHPADSSPAIEIPLDLGDRSLAGRVEDPDGAPVADAHVRLMGSRQGEILSSHVRWTGVTDGIGEFAFDGLGAGPYQLTVTVAGHAEVTVVPDLDEGWAHVVIAPLP